MKYFNKRILKEFSHSTDNYFLKFHGNNAINENLQRVSSKNTSSLKGFSIKNPHFQNLLTPEYTHHPFFAQKFIDEVIGCVMNKDLLSHPMIDKSSKAVAEYYLKDIIVGAYSDSSGIMKIRENFKILVEEKEKISNFDIKNLYLTSGSINSLDHISTAIFQKQDKVLLPNPTNPNVINYFLSKEINPVFYQVNTNSQASGFDFVNLERLLKENYSGEGVKALFISNPQEPSGIIYSNKDIERIIQFCYENKLVLISWEVGRNFIHHPEKKEYTSTYSILDSMSEPYKSKQELFQIFSSSKGLPTVDSIRSACFTAINIDPQVNAEIYKYKSIDLCSSIPSQIVFDLYFNQNMFNILKDVNFENKYIDSIKSTKDKYLNTIDVINKKKSSSFQIKPIKAGFNLFTKVNFDSKVLFNNRETASSVLSPGLIYGPNNENYVNILINPNEEYDFLDKY